ncbi:MAG: type II toxin-antitoxin system PemK/MazF family toxin [Microcystis aeruginosa Ma_QC_Ch_20071001_S25]|uniref:Type II toxin-antitoxin system PemK/MazF family toxin n=4 Tax=Microcystis TaxID=1125 RepID=A0A552H8Z2_MICVR|nr:MULTISPECIES: type II toxin-antitoxin system PemK/MazF family toxin [Microcystis]MCA2927563.1 type II toxin-antitoxin system PemK/MazF family toxin [Microcystis sp. M020S1]MCA2936732.1 type II toxin-antitoxin system PemK/MazF family toxin [Microcystis sp. M015S1]MDJ0545972.1 type II toxin-antitoxin system PemK/MazF family toxin [Microcystis sp. M53601_WE4]NCQ70883.1 type II toxin-antitoxin system PemK/MazF family toxin [Microcystis aeruginosa W13-16]NCQ75423.1 type II toxin-antitoxin system
MTNPKPGEVWLVDLGLAAKTRPVVIVSRLDPNPPRALVLYIPITTQNRGTNYEVELSAVRFLRTGSVANIQGLGSISSVRLERKLGELTEENMRKIKQALLFALDLMETSHE